jgi:hypothetical protein
MRTLLSDWMAIGLFAGVVALASLYVYGITARERRRKQARHLREDTLRRRGA